MIFSLSKSKTHSPCLLEEIRMACLTKANTLSFFIIIINVNGRLSACFCVQKCILRKCDVLLLNCFISLTLTPCQYILASFFSSPKQNPSVPVSILYAKRLLCVWTSVQCCTDIKGESLFCFPLVAFTPSAFLSFTQVCAKKGRRLFLKKC